jgi:hypothetical protein
MAIDDSEAVYFKWRQPSAKYASADFHRNWRRWILWSVVFTVSVAVLSVLLPPKTGSHQSDQRVFQLVFLAALFVGVFGFQYLTALCMWTVRVGNGAIKLGDGRGARYLDFDKITSIKFVQSAEPRSMIVRLKSGYGNEIFFDGKTVAPSDLTKYFQSMGITVDEAAT